jgi:hypothetical protein
VLQVFYVVRPEWVGGRADRAHGAWGACDEGLSRSS